MLILPSDIMPVLQPFMQAFSDRTWQWVQVLIVGTILAPGKRTVTAILRVMGLSDEPQFQLYHRVLNRVPWSGLLVSRILLGLLVATFAAAGCPLILAADETLERRSSAKIKAVGAFRDAVRSRKKYPVYSFGLRWVSMMLLVPVPWSTRVWALPFLTVLAPGEKADAAQGKHHKTSIDWVCQMLSQVRRWLPHAALILVVDGGLSSLKLARQCRRGRIAVTLVARLRIDAGLYDPPAVRPPGRSGPPPKKGKRQPSLSARLADPATAWEAVTVAWYGGTTRVIELSSATALWYKRGEAPVPIRWVLVRDPRRQGEATALFTTDLEATAVQVVSWYVLRWSEEVTFQEVRAHLGVETQRQWSALAIARTTPALLGMFSVITLLAQQLLQGQPHPVRRAAWYVKPEATFADTIALVRRHLLQTVKYTHSACQTGDVPIPSAVLHGLIDSFCYAA